LDYALVFSVLILLAAPLLSRLLAARPFVQAGMDGFVMVAILGLVSLNLLPEALAAGGVVAGLMALVGLLLPWIAELVVHKSEAMMHRALILVAAFALVLHAASDGAILAASKSLASGDMIAAGVLIHRIGVGLAVWWLLTPMLRAGTSYVILSALAVMTVVGYLLFDLAINWYGLPLIGYWQAFAAGSLLHVVLHPVGEQAMRQSSKSARAHRIGTGLGVLFVIVAVVTHFASHPDTDTVGAPFGNSVADMLYTSGVGGGLVLLLPLLLAAFAGYIKSKSTVGGWHYCRGLMPWTVLLWLVMTYSAMLGLISFQNLAGMMPVFLFWVWAFIIVAGLILLGARIFFTPLVPARLRKHTHDHSNLHSAHNSLNRDD